MSRLKKSNLKMFKTGWVDRHLTDYETRGLATHLAKQLSYDQSVPEEDFLEPAREADIDLMKIPRVRPVKMAKQEHVDAFFEKGTLRLGTYYDFESSGNPEVQDHQEGFVSLIAAGESRTAWGTFEGGEDNYIFCTYLGAPDPKVIEAFEYDSCFFISDPVGFTKAVQASINSQSYSFGRCVCCEEKALVGTLRQDHDFNRLDARTIEMVGEAMHYVKPVKYSHQREFRLTWRMPHTVRCALIINCPDAVKFCERT